MSERNRCCCNCRHDIRTWEDGNCTNYCEIDGHYIGYVECFEGWCRHWAKDKWQEEGADDEVDLIKRSDAVEVVYKALKTPLLKGVLTDTMSLAIALVQDIPSADRPQEWIPCSERLPDDRQKAIACNKHGEMMIGTYTNWGWMFPCYFEKPVAWMPLPESYREDG